MSQTVLPSPSLPLRGAAAHHDPEAAKRALDIEDEIERRQRHFSVEWHRRAYVFGRIALGVMFVLSGLAKARAFETTAAAIGGLGLVFPGFIATCVIAVELAGGALVIAGLFARKTAAVLIAYLAFITVIALSDFSVDLNRAFAVANLAFAGALLMLIGNGAGLWSVDGWLRRREARREISAQL